MKIFIWERVDNATSNYHSEGGVLVVAENIEHAMKLAEGQGVTFSSKYDSPYIGATRMLRPLRAGCAAEAREGH